MADFAEYAMPIQYTSIIAEHTATRTSAGLFDISHMGRLRFEGPRADQLLDHLLTRKVRDMINGQVRYSLICNEDGGIIDDVLVSCLESPSGRGEYFLLVVNASNRPAVLKWLMPHLADFPDVTMADVTEQTAMIAVQGPRAIEICKPLFRSSIESMGYYRARVTDQMGKPTIISRTGYTGEDGFELIVKSEDAVRVWENLLLAGRESGIAPIGLAARDTLRLEAAMPLYGHELDLFTDPYEAGLGFAVNLVDHEGKQRGFIGSESLARAKVRLPRKKRIGLRLQGVRAARQNARIIDEDSREIGIITSGSPSPTLNCPIAMGYIDPSMSSIGESLRVDVRGAKIDAKVIALPFYSRK